MVEMVGHALWGMAGAQSPGGADSQSTLPPSQSVDPASIVAAAAGTHGLAPGPRAERGCGGAQA